MRRSRAARANRRDHVSATSPSGRGNLRSTRARRRPRLCWGNHLPAGAAHPPPPPPPGARGPPSRVVQNKNVEWVGAPGAWAVYLGAIATSWLLLVNFLSAGQAWTAVHLAHTAVTFYGFHWVKGTPGLDESGQYYKETFWEQLDDGVQGTVNRKFLTLVPALLFVIASHTSEYGRSPLVLNTAGVLLTILPKLPFMARVRVFGINKY